MLFYKGKILKVKTGYNPNSSSIGTNLTPLIIIGGILSIAIPIISIFVARKLKEKKKQDNNNDK